MAKHEESDLAAQLRDAAETIDKLGDSPAVQELQKPLLARVPKNVRAAIYETGKWLGLVGGAGLAVAGIVGGDPQRFIEAGGLLLISVQGFIAKANLA